MKTNFSHIIYAERHTEAASWIVQLSPDSPDINITLDPDHVYMKTEDEQSSVQLCSFVCDSQASYTAESQGSFPSYTASLTGDSQCIPAYSSATIVLFAIVFTLAVIFVVLYLYKKHIGPCCHDPQKNFHEHNNNEVQMQPNDEPEVPNDGEYELLVSMDLHLRLLQLNIFGSVFFCS